MSFAGRLRQLASETAIYGVSNILGRLLTFLLFPFYTQVFTPDEYGIVSIVYAAFIFLNIVYQYGMESAYLKYAAEAETEVDRQRVFSTALASLLASSAVLSLLLVALRGPFAALMDLPSVWTYLFYYVAVILTLDALAALPLAALRLASRPLAFALARLGGIVVNVAVNIWLILGQGMGVEAVFIANVASSATTLLLVAPTYVRYLRPRFDGALWRTLLAFGLPFLPGGLGYAVSDRVNIFFLSRMDPARIETLYPRAAGAAQPDAYSEYVVGLFGGGMKLAALMMLVVQMFRYAWQPFFLQRARDADAPQLFARVFTLLTAASLLVWLGVSFFAQELVALPLPGGRRLIAEAYWPGLVIVPVALLAYVFQGWYYTFAAGAYLEEKTKYFVHCTLVGSVVAVTVNALLVPHYGMVAAAWATTLAYATMAVMLWAIVRRFYPVPYEWPRVLGAFVLAALLMGAWTALSALQVWWIEGGLLLGFVGALGAAGVIPLRRG
ncbi:MAG: polysaccharide biosynthesis C-terminal domain-containing protein [Bacteroidota bacterium]